jgi:hypothetical protein
MEHIRPKRRNIRIILHGVITLKIQLKNIRRERMKNYIINAN